MTDDLICEHEAEYKRADFGSCADFISRLIISLNRPAKNQRVDTIGKRVRALRKEAGLTQAQLIAQMNSVKGRDAVGTQAGMSMIEGDKTEIPSAPVLAGLCRVLGTTPDYILYGTPPTETVLNAESLEFAKLYQALSAHERHNLRLLYSVARTGKQPDHKTWTAPGGPPAADQEGDSGLQPFDSAPIRRKPKEKP